MFNNKGQSLLEVIVAMAIFALISAIMVSLSIGGFVTLDVGGQQTEAQVYAQEGVEAVRAIRDRAWNELIYNTSTVATSSGQWVFVGEGTISQRGVYTRTISVQPVCRDANNDIADCPATYTDIHTKKVVSQVDWPVRNTTNTVKQVTYLTNWDTNFWIQTNWVGSTGQNIWSDATKYLSDDGNINNATTGTLQLKYTPSSGCGPMVWDFSNQYQYTYSTTNTEVVGSFGQLKDLGFCLGTTSTCSGLSNQSSCQSQIGCSWFSSYSSSNPSIRNTNSYTPAQISYWSGFAASSTLNGGQIYYQLSDDDGVTWKYWNGTIWATSTLSTHYNTSTIINNNIQTFSTSSKKIMFKAFLSSDGSQQVKLDHVQVDCSLINDFDFSNSALYTYNTSTIQVAEGIAQLKDLGGPASCFGSSGICSSYSDTSTCVANGCSWDGNTIYTTTSPSINPNVSLSVPTTTFYKWTRFIETAITNGGNIFYQLSDDDGVTWKYWNNGWVAAGISNYNNSSTVDANIATFPTTTGKLMFRAFLTSNGSQLIQLDNIRIEWQELTGVSSYTTFGNLISSAFNLLDPSPVSVISWTANTSTCSNCGVKFQVRTAPNNGGVPGTWSSWYGKNGVGDYFTDYRGEMIPKILNWNQWVQYQVFLTGDGNSTPILNDVTIYYK